MADVPLTGGYMVAAYVVTAVILLAERHRARLSQQHPGVGVLGEALGGFLGGRERAPAVLDGAAQPHERRVALRERRGDGAADPEPPVGAFGGVALAGRRAPHGEADESGAQGAEHCLIMVLSPVRLQPRMPLAPRPDPPTPRPLAGPRVGATRARRETPTPAHARAV